MHSFARSKKWYKRAIWRLFDIAFLNSWFLYRHGKEVHPTLFDYKYDLARILLQGATPPAPQHLRIDAPAALEAAQELSDTESNEEAEKPDAPIPKKARRYLGSTPEQIRFDGQGHLPDLVPNKGRCKFPKMEGGKQVACNKTTVCKCQKCDVHLYLVPDRNHFLAFHQK